MSRIIITAFSTIFITSLSFSQDIITMKSGENLKAKVLEITPSEIKFKKIDSIEGSTFTLPKSDILMISYDDGTKDIFSIDTNNFSTTDLCNQGQFDSEMNYRGKNSGTWGTYITTIVLTPVVGLIPAVICSSAEPSDKNLLSPNPELMKNSNYNHCYRMQSYKIKKTKIWISYGIGSAMWIAGIIMFFI